MNYRQSKSIFATVALTSSIALSFYPSLIQAQQSDPENAVFLQPPYLVEANADRISVWARGAKYYFTIAVPDDAGTSLQKLTIRQRQGGENINYQVDQTSAFFGTPDNRGENLSIKTMAETENTAPITIDFDTPIPPGTTFTVVLVPKINPGFGETYSFEVTGFPMGNMAQGVYLGVGKISFITNFF
jgi:hypothetical protein